MGRFLRNYYKTYKRSYDKLKKQGSMDRRLTYEQYKEMWTDAKSLGMKNIPQTIAKMQVKFSKRQANAYLKEIKNKGYLGQDVEVYNDEGEYLGTMNVKKQRDITFMPKIDRDMFFDYLISIGIKSSEAREIYDDTMSSVKAAEWL